MEAALDSGPLRTQITRRANTFVLPQAPLGAATASGITLANTTAAASGAQQYSPAITWTGQGWKTTATAASQSVEFRTFVVPVQGTSAPSAMFTISSNINSAGWNDRFSASSGGYFNALLGFFTGSDASFSNYTGYFSGSGIRMSSGAVIGWSNNGSQGSSWSATTGASLSRGGDCTLQLGVDHATAALAQTFKSANTTTGVGGSLTIAGGTGSTAGGAIAQATYETTSISNRSYHAAKPTTLTESSATLFANIAIAAAKYVGAKLVCTVFASDATDHQSLTSDVAIQAVNKGGTVTATVTQVDSTTAASSGTLTATYTVVANGNGVDIKCNAVSSLTQTTLSVKWSIVSLNSNDAGVVTAY